MGEVKQCMSMLEPHYIVTTMFEMPRVQAAAIVERCIEQSELADSQPAIAHSLREQMQTIETLDYGTWRAGKNTCGCPMAVAGIVLWVQSNDDRLHEERFPTVISAFIEHYDEEMAKAVLNLHEDAKSQGTLRLV